MGTGVKIRKYKETNHTHFYKLYSLDGDQIAIYMKIDALNNIVTYSTCSNFSHIESEIDMTDENAIVKSIPNVDYRIISKGILRAIKALQTQNFPECMDYIS